MKTHIGKEHPVTTRLRFLGQERFGSGRGWQTAFARSLGMTLQSLRPYLAGRYLPGRALENRLRRAGYDVEFLNTGVPMKHATAVHENLPEYVVNSYVKELIERIKQLEEENRKLRSMFSAKALKLIYERKER